MSNEIISYIDMCQREGLSLQKGMNFRSGGDHSVILLSVRPNAPYRDRYEEDGAILIYEGHDESRRTGAPDPKLVDQPQFTPAGRPTENGKFFRAAMEAQNGSRPPERVRAYEKLRAGIWSYAGPFDLVDAWTESDGTREVFKFKLASVADEDEALSPSYQEHERARIIPTAVKLEVWQRDKGQCVTCGATDELHFDHIIPYSRGGTSLKAENIQLLCARHNLSKSDKIQ